MSQGYLLHSVSYAGLWGQAFLSVEDFISKAAQLGYDGVMLMAKRPHLSILDYGAQQRSRLRTLIETHKLRHVVIAGYNNLTADMEHGEVPHREIQTQYIVELATLARDVGAQTVRIFTGYDNPAADYSRQWRLIVDTLKECAGRTAGLGVTLGVQNHHDMAVGYQTLHDLIRTVNEPNCKAMFDAWAPALHGENLESAAGAMGPMTVHTTIADYQLRPRYRYNAALVNYEKQTPFVQAVPMGEGFIDYKEFLGALSRSGFQGTVAYEMCSPLADGGDLATLDRYAARFLEYMR
ncbi:MAG TPA: sugar phosphate isomerase/epimerase family protein [Bryobacteraceae bacterium]|nr:sugar phosphate isomerase/epimerase family protein [Bryobacteraceae bacterium]